MAAELTTQPTRAAIGLFLAASLVLAWLPAGATGAQAADAPNLEYPIKATFLEKFGDFITWPADSLAAPTDAFNICLLGEDPFGPVIDQAMRGQAQGTHAVVLNRLGDSSQADKCHILYLGKSAPTEAVLRALAGHPVLTVTDTAAGAGDLHGVIHFVVRDNRVRFTIDDALAAADHLVISSKLLNVALSVSPRPKAAP